MQNQANIKAVITADDRASAAVKNFGNNVEGIGGKAKKAFKAVGIAAAAVTTAVVGFGVASVKAFSEAEDGIAQTNAVLKSTKGVAGVTAKAVDDLASSLQSVTKFSDEEVRSAENLLLTFTKIGKDIFPEVTKTVLDMSTALGQDLKSSSVQLGKALQDPVLGITALRRVGVNFSDAQKDVIQSLVDTGRSAEAQKLILKELKTEFGGSAEAAGKTFAGKLTILKNTFNDLQESIGGVIVNALTPLATKLSVFVSSDQFQNWLKQVNTWIATNLPIAINYFTTTLWPAVKDAFNTTWPIIKTVVTNLASVANWIITNKPVLYTLIGAFVALKTAMAISSAVTAFKASMATVKATFIATRAVISSPITMPAIAVAAALASLWQVYRAYQSIKEANKAMNAAASANNRVTDEHDRLRAKAFAMINSGNKTQATRGRALLSDLSRINKGGFAVGTNYAPGGMAMVGEQGAELVNLPRGSQVMTNSKTKAAVSQPINLNLTIQAGVMTGSESDMRKLAAYLKNTLQDMAQSKGVSVQQFLGN